MFSSTIVRVLLLVCGLLVPQATISAAQAQDRNDLDSIRKSGVLRVGAAIADPFYRRDVRGNWDGIIPDFMDEIAKYLGVKIEYVETTWGTAAAGLQTGKFDVMGAYNTTPDRALAVDFTRAVGNITFGLLTISGDPAQFKTWEEIEKANFELLTVEGTGSHRMMKQLRPNMKWRGVANRDTYFLELESGRSKFGLLDAVGAQQYIDARKKGIYVQVQPAYASATNLAIRKVSNTELLRWLDTTLGYMESLGEYDRIWGKYLPKK
jgi:polar amino acid transport system substrate-binding protein